MSGVLLLAVAGGVETTRALKLKPFCGGDVTAPITRHSGRSGSRDIEERTMKAAQQRSRASTERATNAKARAKARVERMASTSRRMGKAATGKMVAAVRKPRMAAKRVIKPKTEKRVSGLLTTLFGPRPGSKSDRA
jgi:hypothetical protein